MVIRVSRGSFDPARLAEVQRMAEETGRYLIPAIRALPGLVNYWAAVSPTGTMTHVSLWDTEEHAQQMASLPLMIVNARQAAEAAGVTFIPIVNYDVLWEIERPSPRAA